MMIHRKDCVCVFINNYCHAKISDTKPAKMLRAPSPQTTEYGTRVLRSQKLEIGRKGI